MIAPDVGEQVESMRTLFYNLVMQSRVWCLAGCLAAAAWSAAAADSLQTTPPAPATPAAPTKARPPLSTWLPQLRVGDQVKIEGEMRRGGGLLGREIKVVHGDFDESEITATVTGLDANRKAITTNLGVGVETTVRTQVHARGAQQDTFASLQVGDHIEAEGQLQKNGTLLADEIEIKKAKKSGQKADEDELSGRIEAVDVEARKIVVLGVAVYFDEQTKNKTPFMD